MDLQSQQQPLLPRENDGMLSEDWHQYTLHSSSKNDAHENSRPATSPHQRYESLGLLLLQSGTSPSFFDPDEESCDRGSAIADEDSRGREHVPRRRARRRVRYDAPRAIACGLLALGALGALLGLVVFPPPAEGGGGATRWDATSNVLGATYSLAWTLSFYPQIVTNWRHPAAAQRGVSLDFVAWNVVGFSCYAIYTTSLKCSGVVRREYAERFGGGNGDHDTSPPGLGVATQSGYYFANIKYEISSTTIGSDSSSVSGPAAVPQVKANDVAFAWHALILTLITFAQIVWWSESDSPRDIHAEREGWVAVDQGRREPCANSVTSGVAVEDAFIGSNCNVHVATNISKHGTEYSMQQHPRRQRRKREGTTTPHISPTTKYFILLLLLLCIVLAILVACNVNIGSWGGQWLDYLYFLSFVKVGVSIVKYIPQVVLNYRRKSTSGWQIWNILLDFSGGALSIVQLVGDSVAEARAQGLSHGWTTGIAGNPAKLGLGMVSICFDLIFMFQHYVLYRHSSDLSKNPSRSEHDAIRNKEHESPLLAD